MGGIELSLVGRAGGLAREALNLLLPPRCLACGTLSSEPGTLCADCWPQLRFIAPPFCRACGLPFDFDLGPATLCAACLAERRAIDRVRAVLAYDEASRGLVLAFKHGDRTDAAPGYAAWMARAGAELLEQADLIAPVPLHRSRLFARRYNQSALLARPLADRADARLALQLLLRRRRTPSQGRLSASARRRNVAGAFALHSAWRGRLGGLRILLIDDVYTSGATGEACARVLLRAGAAAVDLLVLARVLRGRSDEKRLTEGETGLT